MTTRADTPDNARDASTLSRRGGGLLIKRTVGALVAGLLLAATAFVPAHADGGVLAWPKDTVYVVDQSNTRWPVERAAENLDNNSPLELIRVTSCPAKGAQCIYVRTKNIPGAGIGTTVYAHRGVDLASATVYLDSSYQGSSYHNRLALTTHELGHAVGLSHQGIGSIMNPYVSSRTRSTPSSADYARLNKAY